MIPSDSNTIRTGRLLCFGLGYTGLVLARRLLAEGWSVAGTSRDPGRVAELAALGIDAVRFDRDHPLPPAALDGATHVLSAVPPDALGDPVAAACGPAIAAVPGVEWVGYLSATSVYGDYRGAWVDETQPLRPSHERAWRRLAAEQAWDDLLRRHGLPVHVFRLAAIYGPGSSQLDQVRQGRARRLVKPGQVFARIHVDDIATILRASMARPRPGAVYNVCDDECARPQDVVAYACDLLGVPPPPEEPYDPATLTPMQQSFWIDNRRLRNDRVKHDLGVVLAYPDYRAGLAAILAGGG